MEILAARVGGGLMPVYVGTPVCHPTPGVDAFTRAAEELGTGGFQQCTPRAETFGF